VLSQGQIDLFDLACSKVLGVELEKFRSFFYQQDARPVALACRAAGIDRSVFPTVFNLSRQARNTPGALAPADLAATETIFTDLSRQMALEQFQAQS
jgi:hypothetical protein